MRPRGEAVHRALKGQPAQATPNVTRRLAVMARVRLFGQVAVCLINGEVIEGEPAVDGRAQWPWFDHGGVVGAGESGEHFPGTVG